jgi:Ankyrin repeats (3 copies)/Ankyrin repeats (many copies)
MISTLMKQKILIIVSVTLFLMIMFVFRTGSGGDSRDRDTRALIDGIENNNLDKVRRNARACMLPIVQQDILDKYTGGSYFYIMPIHIAVRLGRIEILKLLAELKRDYRFDFKLDADARDSYGCTPLMHARFGPEKTKYECVRFLISQGANINATDAVIRSTALHDGVHGINKKYVELLIGLGANVNLQDSLGRTPLHILCDMGQKITPDHEFIFDALIKANADANIKDNKGLTVFQYAKTNNDKIYIDKFMKLNINE